MELDLPWAWNPWHLTSCWTRLWISWLMKAWQRLQELWHVSVKVAGATLLLTAGASAACAVPTAREQRPIQMVLETLQRRAIFRLIVVGCFLNLLLSAMLMGPWRVLRATSSGNERVLSHSFIALELQEWKLLDADFQHLVLVTRRSTGLKVSPRAIGFVTCNVSAHASSLTQPLQQSKRWKKLMAKSWSKQLEKEETWKNQERIHIQWHPKWCSCGRLLLALSDLHVCGQGRSQRSDLHVRGQWRATAMQQVGRFRWNDNGCMAAALCTELVGMTSCADAFAVARNCNTKMQHPYTTL